jgi:hypothetical protein
VTPVLRAREPRVTAVFSFAPINARLKDRTFLNSDYRLAENRHLTQEPYEPPYAYEWAVSARVVSFISLFFSILCLVCLPRQGTEELMRRCECAYSHYCNAQQILRSSSHLSFPRTSSHFILQRARALRAALTLVDFQVGVSTPDSSNTPKSVFDSDNASLIAARQAAHPKAAEFAGSAGGAVMLADGTRLSAAAKWPDFAEMVAELSRVRDELSETIDVLSGNARHDNPYFSLHYEHPSRPALRPHYAGQEDDDVDDAVVSSDSSGASAAK